MKVKVKERVNWPITILLILGLVRYFSSVR